MDQQDLDLFLQKYILNQHTAQEHNRFVMWLRSAPLDEVNTVLEKYGLYFESMEELPQQQYPGIEKKIEAELDSIAHRNLLIKPERQNRSLFKRFFIAAAAIILITTAAITFWPQPIKQHITRNIAKNDQILPGTNKAVLTLANGAKIILDSTKNGIITKEGNIAICKNNNGGVIYAHPKTLLTKANTRILYNTISTPYGGQYQVILPDGSKVWLNAASWIKFPTAFTGNYRSVELMGEAYFEVAKNNAQPFKITVNQMQVEVLGTHFNIMAYADENSTKTTLLEGSVKVTKGYESKTIAPGQQADVQENIKVFNVDANQAIEWKNGNFNFSHENIKTIMRKVARWYNVEVIFQGPITNEGFVGVIPRSENISDVLNALELTKLVHFKLQERRVTVMP